MRGGGKEEQDRDLAGDPARLPEHGAAREIAAEQAQRQRQMKQRKMAVEAAPERKLHPQHCGDDHRRVREHHRHYEPEEHGM